MAEGDFLPKLARLPGMPPSVEEVENYEPVPDYTPLPVTPPPAPTPAPTAPDVFIQPPSLEMDAQRELIASRSQQRYDEAVKKVEEARGYTLQQLGPVEKAGQMALDDYFAKPKGSPEYVQAEDYLWRSGFIPKLAWAREDERQSVAEHIRAYERGEARMQLLHPDADLKLNKPATPYTLEEVYTMPYTQFQKTALKDYKELRELDDRSTVAELGRDEWARTQQQVQEEVRRYELARDQLKSSVSAQERAAREGMFPGEREQLMRVWALILAHYKLGGATKNDSILDERTGNIYSTKDLAGMSTSQLRAFVIRHLQPAFASYQRDLERHYAKWWRHTHGMGYAGEVLGSGMEGLYNIGSVIFGYAQNRSLAEQGADSFDRIAGLCQRCIGYTGAAMIAAGTRSPGLTGAALSLIPSDMAGTIAAEMGAPWWVQLVASTTGGLVSCPGVPAIVRTARQAGVGATTLGIGGGVAGAVVGGEMFRELGLKIQEATGIPYLGEAASYLGGFAGGGVAGHIGMRVGSKDVYYKPVTPKEGSFLIEQIKQAKYQELGLPDQYLKAIRAETDTIVAQARGKREKLARDIAEERLPEGAKWEASEWRVYFHPVKGISKPGSTPAGVGHVEMLPAVLQEKTVRLPAIIETQYSPAEQAVANLGMAQRLVSDMEVARRLKQQYQPDPRLMASDEAVAIPRAVRKQVAGYLIQLVEAVRQTARGLRGVKKQARPVAEKATDALIAVAAELKQGRGRIDDVIRRVRGAYEQITEAKGMGLDVDDPIRFGMREVVGAGGERVYSLATVMDDLQTLRQRVVERAKEVVLQTYEDATKSRSVQRWFSLPAEFRARYPQLNPAKQVVPPKPVPEAVQNTPELVEEAVAQVQAQAPSIPKEAVRDFVERYAQGFEPTGKPGKAVPPKPPKPGKAVPIAVLALEAELAKAQGRPAPAAAHAAPEPAKAVTEAPTYTSPAEALSAGQVNVLKSLTKGTIAALRKQYQKVATQPGSLDEVLAMPDKDFEQFCWSELKRLSGGRMPAPRFRSEFFKMFTRGKASRPDQVPVQDRAPIMMFFRTFSTGQPFGGTPDMPPPGRATTAKLPPAKTPDAPVNWKDYEPPAIFKPENLPVGKASPFEAFLSTPSGLMPKGTLEGWMYSNVEQSNRHHIFVRQVEGQWIMRQFAEWAKKYRVKVDIDRWGDVRDVAIPQNVQSLVIAAMEGSVAESSYRHGVDLPATFKGQRVTQMHRDLVDLVTQIQDRYYGTDFLGGKRAVGGILSSLHRVYQDPTLLGDMSPDALAVAKQVGLHVPEQTAVPAGTYEAMLATGDMSLQGYRLASTKAAMVGPAHSKKFVHVPPEMLSGSLIDVCLDLKNAAVRHKHYLEVARPYVVTYLRASERAINDSKLSVRARKAHSNRREHVIRWVRYAMGVPEGGKLSELWDFVRGAIFRQYIGGVFGVNPRFVLQNFIQLANAPVAFSEVTGKMPWEAVPYMVKAYRFLQTAEGGELTRALGFTRRDYESYFRDAREYKTPFFRGMQKLMNLPTWFATPADLVPRKISAAAGYLAMLDTNPGARISVKPGVSLYSNAVSVAQKVSMLANFRPGVWGLPIAANNPVINTLFYNMRGYSLSQSALFWQLLKKAVTARTPQAVANAVWGYASLIAIGGSEALPGFLFLKYIAHKAGLDDNPVVEGITSFLEKHNLLAKMGVDPQGMVQTLLVPVREKSVVDLLEGKKKGYDVAFEFLFAPAPRQASATVDLITSLTSDPERAGKTLARDMARWATEKLPGGVQAFRLHNLYQQLMAENAEGQPAGTVPDFDYKGDLVGYTTVASALTSTLLGRPIAKKLEEQRAYELEWDAKSSVDARKQAESAYYELWVRGKVGRDQKAATPAELSKALLEWGKLDPALTPGAALDRAMKRLETERSKVEPKGNRVDQLLQKQLAPTLLQLAERARAKGDSDTLTSIRKEVERRVKEGKAKGINAQVLGRVRQTTEPAAPARAPLK